MKSVKYSFQLTGASFDRIEARETDYLYISGSQIAGAGNGLFTAISIWEHEIIAVFKGEKLSQEEADNRAKAGNNKYFMNMPDGTIMDSMFAKSFAKYANDTGGQVKSVSGPNSVITLDDDNRVCLVAIRDIKAGEEIFCSYGKRYWKKSAGFRNEVKSG
ncbi:MAG: SET domain-containing protein [Lentimicrobium sp.]|nr:SET domain-containing protein [Lentimicrobium sp.]